MNEFYIYNTDERLIVRCAWDIGLPIDKADADMQKTREK